MRNKTTGELLWDWSHPKHTWTIEESAINYKDKYFFFCDLEGPITVLDAASGIEVWKDDLKGGSSSSRAVINNDFVYYAHNDNSPFERTESHLVRSKIEEWQWDTLYSIYKTESPFPSIHPPAIWKNKQEQEILIFQDRGLSFDEPTHLFAYNADKEEIVWKYDSIVYKSSVNKPVIKGDLLYYIGLDQIFCFHIPTGSQRWVLDINNNETGEAFFTTTLHFVEDKIIFEAYIARYAVNAETGAIIWRRGGLEDLFSCDGRTAFHDGVLYLACVGGIYALDGDTGETLWIEDKLGEGFLNGITVDPETGYLYTANSEYAWCLKVKE
ncbi:MAG: PQQ-binding-like beta-propeller repeat protein [Bacteroidota bacterium]